MPEEFSNTNSQPQEDKKSKYNSAVAQLYRMDDLWKDAHKHARNVNYPGWNEDLDRMWLELVSDAKQEHKEFYLKINNQIAEAALYSLSEKLRSRNPGLYSKLINIQKKLLMGKEEFLRQLQDKQGKGTAYEDDIDAYMD
jgi:hypothetical protein|tara:strand:- start:122 stop:541 length:420 start_codon:yes stop_codon:yes gene_type:complete